MRETTIGWLKRGDYFCFEGKKYKVERCLENRHGYVSCIDMDAKKKKIFYIETDVEVEN